MITRATSSTDAVQVAQASWMPMVVIALAQIILIFNVSTLQVSVDGIASSFGAPATTVGTAIVTYALVVAGFIMLGGRIAEMFGARRVFRATVLAFAAAMTLAALGPNETTMILAQIVAGAAAAALVPTLVVLVAQHYSGSQRERALGLLGGAFSLGIVLAFLIAGFLATAVHWRATFGLLVVLSAVTLRLSSRFVSIEGRPGVQVDRVGVALIAMAILLISLGSDNLARWGVLLATHDAPFSILDMSPAPFMIVAGLFLGQAFLSWSARRQRAGATPLLALEVVDSPKERAALFTLFVISALASAITFLVPLYIQIVQGRSSFDTAIAVIPFSLASVVAAVLVVRLFDRVSPRRIAQTAFLMVAAGVAFLAVVIRNDWSDVAVISSLALTGLGEGALITLLFNVLVSASPRELAGDVGSLRGAANNLATAVGTAAAGALVAGLLASGIHRDLVHSDTLPGALKTQIDLDNPAFVSNDELRRVLSRTSATPEQVEEAVAINAGARLVALKVTFFTLAGVSLLAFFPAGALPGYVRRQAPGAGRASEPEDLDAVRRAPTAEVPTA